MFLIKKIKDYYEQIFEMYPDVPKLDIKRILNYGWKSLYLHNSYGGDVQIKDLNFWCYFGNLTGSALKHFEYYIKKLATKLRVTYRKKKIPFSKCYYFALTNKLYENVLKQINKKGRPKKWIDFGSVFLYLVLDECKVREYNCTHIFKLPYYVDIGFKIYKLNLKTNLAELIITRNPLKFEDVSVEKNDYDVL